jgi:hypothetical protein
LTRGEHKASGRVRSRYRPFKYRQESFIRLDADEKFGSSDTRNGKGSLHLQATGATAEEMRGSPEQIDYPGPFFFHGLEGDRRVRVKPENRLVKQGNVGSASFQYPNLITGAECVI